MVSTWSQQKQEQSYLDQLEQMVVQRLRVSEEPFSAAAVKTKPRAVQFDDAVTEADVLSPLSREINEELDRLERLMAQANIS
jgi:hypothetical protein